MNKKSLKILAYIGINIAAIAVLMLSIELNLFLVEIGQTTYELKYIIWGLLERHILYAVILVLHVYLYDKKAGEYKKQIGFVQLLTALAMLAVCLIFFSGYYTEIMAVIVILIADIAELVLFKNQSVAKTEDR